MRVWAIGLVICTYRGAYYVRAPRRISGTLGKIVRWARRRWRERVPRTGKRRATSDLKPEHREILSLYLAGLSVEAIASAMSYSVDAVDSALDRFVHFFPELKPLRGDGRRQALIHAGRIYLEDYERRERLEVRLVERLRERSDRAEVPQQMLRVLQDYSVGSRQVIAALGPIRFWQYVRGRLDALGLNYSRAERSFQRVKDVRGSKNSQLRGVILNDLANAQTQLGDLTAAKETAQACRDLYRQLRYQADEVADTTLLGEARALIEEQHAWCFGGSRAQCHLLHEDAKAVLEEMRVPDYYGWSKTYEMLGMCSFLQGMVDGDQANLAEAATYMQKSYDYAWDVKSDLSNFWWTFRDGTYLGRHWRKLIASAAATDIYLELGDLSQAKEYEALRKEEFQNFTVEWWAKQLPPLVPIYSWKLDLLVGMGPTTIAQYLRKRILDATSIGLNIYLPLLFLSYGDFLRAVRKGPGLLDLMPVEPRTIREAYRQAGVVAARHQFRLMEELARSRLSHLEENGP
jgi:hypothetical protein